MAEGLSAVTQEMRVHDPDSRGRRNNVVNYRLTENKRETPASLQERVVQEVFGTEMGVPITSIQKIHRVCKFRLGSNKPIIMRLFNYREKTELFPRGHKLRGTDLLISDYYSRGLRVRRKHLWEHAEAKKHEGTRTVKLSYDKLFIAGKPFTWDSEQHEVMRLRQQ